MLEERLNAKKMELASGAENKAEKEVFKDVVKEINPQDFPQVVSASSSSDDDAIKRAHVLEEKEHSEIVDSLIADAMSKGLAHAIKTANAMRNPHLLDDFHDALADKYYEKLLEARKIKR